MATLSLGSPSTMKFQPKKKTSIPGEETVVLEFPVYHGDMVIMHGRAIHRLYEVS